MGVSWAYAVRVRVFTLKKKRKQKKRKREEKKIVANETPCDPLARDLRLTRIMVSNLNDIRIGIINFIFSP